MIQIDEKPHHRSTRMTLICSRPPAARHRCAAVAAVLVAPACSAVLRPNTGAQRWLLFLSHRPAAQCYALPAGDGPQIHIDFIFLSGRHVPCFRAFAAVRLGFRSSSDANPVSNLCPPNRRVGGLWLDVWSLLKTKPGPPRYLLSTCHLCPGRQIRCRKQHVK